MTEKETKSIDTTHQFSGCFFPVCLVGGLFAWFGYELISTTFHSVYLIPVMMGVAFFFFSAGWRTGVHAAVDELKK